MKLNSEIKLSDLSISNKNSFNKREDLDTKVPPFEDQGKKLWDIKMVMSKIFKYFDIESQINASLVNRQWNHVVCPFLRQSLRLLRPNYMKNGTQGNETDRDTLTSLEIQSFVQTNSKYSSIVTKLRINALRNQNIPDYLFTKFCHITQLKLHNLNMSESIFLMCMSQLKCLMSLEVYNTQFTISRNVLQSDVVYLPQTLTELAFNCTGIDSECRAIRKTLISHTNLHNFKFIKCKELELLKPLEQNYPSLKILTLHDNTRIPILNQNQIIRILELNPQLTEFYYASESRDFRVIKLINSHLSNLKILDFQGAKAYPKEAPLEAEFTTPMNLTHLTLNCNQLSTESLISFLNHSGDLKTLKISMYPEFDKISSIIRTKYDKLMELTYYDTELSSRMDVDEFSKLFFETQVKGGAYACAKSLKRLNLGNFNISYLKSEFLDCFQNLELVSFINCFSRCEDILLEEQYDCYLKNFKENLNSFYRWEFLLNEFWYDKHICLYKPNTTLTLYALEKMKYFDLD